MDYNSQLNLVVGSSQQQQQQWSGRGGVNVTTAALQQRDTEDFPSLVPEPPRPAKKVFPFTFL